MNKETDTSFEIYHLMHFLRTPTPWTGAMRTQRWKHTAPVLRVSWTRRSGERDRPDYDSERTGPLCVQSIEGTSVYRMMELSRGRRRWEPFKRLLKDEDWLDTVQIPIQRLLKSSESVFFVPGSLTVSTVPITSEAFRKHLMNHSECKGKEELCYQFSIFSTFVKVFLTYM